MQQARAILATNRAGHTDLAGLSFGMLQHYTEAERQDWLQAKARGRKRFVWRRGVLPTLLICLVVVLFVELFGNHISSFSPRTIVLSTLIILPIALLGGYLQGRWKWKDFVKKYPE